MHPSTVFHAIGFAAALALSHPALAQSWSITDLGTLGGATSVATAINNLGQVVGQADTATGSRAFLYTSGAGMRDLGTFGGDYSYATGINDKGQVVGGAFTSGQAQVHAFVYSNGGGMLDLGAMLGGDYAIQSSAAGINASGTIVGSTGLPGPGHAFAYSPSSGLQNLGAFGGVGAASTQSAAMAINASGQIVGRSDFGGINSHAVLYNPGTGLQDLGTFGGSTSLGVGINSVGLVVGRAALANGIDHAFLYMPGIGMSDIGASLGNGKASVAAGINGAGIVVGGAEFTGSMAAFQYSTTTGLVDLNSLLPSGSGWHLDLALAINDSGQIVGRGTIGGQQRAFLLSPVPEPDAWATLIAGLGLLSLVLCRRYAALPARNNHAVLRTHLPQ